MPNTFELISSTTVGSGGAASIEFTSIPSTYTDLCLKVSLRTSITDADQRNSALLTFNNSGSGYSFRNVYGVGSTAGSGNGSSQSTLYAGVVTASNATASTFSNSEFYIPNYAGSTNKSVSLDYTQENNSATFWVDGLLAGLWANTAAITSVKLIPDTVSNWVQYSTAYLYGVKNA
jgi:hypothetical protein